MLAKGSRAARLCQQCRAESHSVSIRDGEEGVIGVGCGGGSGVDSTGTLLLTKPALQEAFTGGKRPISVIKNATYWPTVCQKKLKICSVQHVPNSRGSIIKAVHQAHHN